MTESYLTKEAKTDINQLLGGSGSGNDNIFSITIFDKYEGMSINPRYSCDKTFEEIDEAYSQGKMILATLVMVQDGRILTSSPLIPNNKQYINSIESNVYPFVRFSIGIYGTNSTGLSVNSVNMSGYVVCSDGSVRPLASKNL